MLTILFVKNLCRGDIAVPLCLPTALGQRHYPHSSDGSLGPEFSAVFIGDPAVLGFSHSVLPWDSLSWTVVVVQPWTSPLLALSCDQSGFCGDLGQVRVAVTWLAVP